MEMYMISMVIGSIYVPPIPKDRLLSKSSLYIADANHSQFNSDWGGYDQTLPAGLFLNRAQIMDADKQRQIAKVYVSAFLETTLHEKEEYQSLFRDYRSGLKWLPDTAYYNRFQSGDIVL